MQGVCVCVCVNMHRQTLAQSHSSIQWASGSWKKSWLIPPLPVGTKTWHTYQAGECTCRSVFWCHRASNDLGELDPGLGQPLLAVLDVEHVEAHVVHAARRGVVVVRHHRQRRLDQVQLHVAQPQPEPVGGEARAVQQACPHDLLVKLDRHVGVLHDPANVVDLADQAMERVLLRVEMAFEGHPVGHVLADVLGVGQLLKDGRAQCLGRQLGEVRPLLDHVVQEVLHGFKQDGSQDELR